MGKLKNESLAQTSDDMGMPTLSEDVFNDMVTEAGFVPTPPSAYEVEKANYDMWLWELTKYDDIHLIKELQDRGYEVSRA